ncbi:MAG: hypothetical protein M5U35_13620 [Roseovarius sp.]|nr:hypothetical protein [Roseovarius sp.]
MRQHEHHCGHDFRPLQRVDETQLVAVERIAAHADRERIERDVVRRNRLVPFRDREGSQLVDVNRHAVPSSG